MAHKILLSLFLSSFSAPTIWLGILPFYHLWPGIAKHTFIIITPYIAFSRALWGLQSLFGVIPNVFGQGRSVKKLLKLEALYSQELGKPKAHNPEIGHLIILDRDLDW